MLDLEVIDEATVATTILDPLRSRVLAALREPGSATTVAKDLGETRQKVNYHLRALESAGLVELVEERPRRGLTEKVWQATARSYVVSPAVLHDHDPGSVPIDRLSTKYLVAVAARSIRELASMTKQAAARGHTVPSLTIDTEIRFASAANRAAFTRELSAAVTDIAARYHDETEPAGRWHRLVVAAHPRPTPTPDPTSDAEDPEHNR